MVKAHKKLPAKKRTSTLRYVDSLIEELSSMHQYAKDSKSPKLVNLKRALKRAQHLRVLLNSKRTTARQWKQIFNCVLFVLEASKKIYSLFINYIQNKEIKHEFWNNNKVIAYC